MANFDISPNMGLPVPIPGVDPGPDYADNEQSSFNIIDGHNHAPGKGVLINPNGLNINADLAINSNNLTLVKTVNFTNLLAPLAGLAPNLGASYVAGGELYYNDESGNVVQITNMGSVNAGAGSITGLPSGTASASYSAGSQTFIWQSATSTAANMDNGSVTIREVAPSANGITLSSPTALAADYTINLLTALPGSIRFLSIDNVGNLATTPQIQGSDIDSATITTTNIAPLAVTVAQMAVPNMVISGSTGTFSQVDDGNFHDITNLTTSITTVGKPVTITFQQDGTSAGGTNASYLSLSGSTLEFLLIRDVSTIICAYDLQQPTGTIKVTPSSLNFIDPSPSAGPHTYKVQVRGTMSLFYTIMIAREL